MCGDEQAKPGALFAIWHENLWLFGLAHHPRFREKRRQFCMLVHPKAFMAPFVSLLDSLGVRSVMGSTGYHGRQASEEIIELLKQGNWDSVVACDGPKGPFRQLKHGILHMSLKSGVPIIPVTFEVTSYRRSRGWDHKLMPWGRNATILVHYHHPITVTEENFEEAGQLLQRALNSQPWPRGERGPTGEGV